MSGLSTARVRVTRTFEPPLRQRIERLGSALDEVEYFPLTGTGDWPALANELRHQVDKGCQVILMASETSIMDSSDNAPRAVEIAGGDVISIGAPVDPGNLLMLARFHDVPILGVPGCARSPKPNVVDRLLPVLLAGIHLKAGDIARLGHGGLIEDGEDDE